jgi:outer membrane protein OmpA-like peptidoglycan-associated protein
VLQSWARADDADRKKLEDLIRSDEWRQPPEDTVAEQVSTRLEAAAESRAEVTRELREDLGPVVAAYGGTIDADGALVFPEKVLFEAGKADITPALRQFLAAVCLPWFQTLERSGAAISDLRIEGHASSEWIGATPEEAYLDNLALSQARAHAVLSTCLELVPGPEGAWARARATAIGYSSSHPVMTDGAEDKAKSRRVVFRADYDLKGVIDDIAKDVGAADAAKRRVFEDAPSQ